MAGSRKAYYVRRVSRCTVTYLVHAEDSAAAPA